MAKPQWHDRLRHELRKRGLPTTYSARLIEELTDHFADLQRENPCMDVQTPADERMGSPELLAAVARQELDCVAFAGRHPIVAFVMGPIPVAILALIVIGLIAGVFIGPQGIHSPTSLDWIVVYLFIYVIRLLPLALAWLYIRLGARVGRSVWGVAACGLMAFFALNIRANIGPATDTENLRLAVGIGGFAAFVPAWWQEIGRAHV